jgi:hypothetical protein
MGSFSLDAILHKARALCEAAGVDPDRPAQDGRPEWFRFIGDARASLRSEQHAQDPLALLKAIEEETRAAETPVAAVATAPESVDPLETLEALYEQEMGGASAPPVQPPAQDAPPGGVRGSDGLAPELSEPAHAIVFSRRRSDPLEELKALEALGMDATRRDDPNLDGASLGEDGEHRAVADRDTHSDAPE